MYTREYYIKNKARIDAANREYANNNKESIKARKRKTYIKNREKACIQAKVHRIKNKEYYKSYFKNYVPMKRKTDLNFKLIANLRSRIWIAVKKNTKGEGTKELLGCTVAFLKEYLESKFTEGMTWGNYGRGGKTWQIDHIKPCASFDMSIGKEQKKCFHYTNLQPLWQKDNLEKRSREF